MKKVRWYPLDVSHKRIVKKLTDSEVGKVIRLSLDYLENGELPKRTELSDITELFLESLIDEIDNAQKAYEQKVEAGRKGGKAKAANQKKSDEDLFAEIDKTETPFN